MSTYVRIALFLTALGVLAGIGRAMPEQNPDRSAVDGGDVATFAGGCFWCMEPPFEKVDGVLEVLSGYTGGDEVNPTYSQVSSGTTGHAESVRVRFDPRRVSYRKLLEVYWRQIDPTDSGGQFADRGKQYRAAIFTHNQVQRRLAETSKAELAASKRFEKPIVVRIEPAGKFYPAEEHHQDYYKKHHDRYLSYRRGSGREAFLKAVWKNDDRPIAPTYPKPQAEEIKKRLTDLQFRVTQEEDTERPFHNEYWDEKRKGIYVDVVTGEPLFASIDKFKSGTGWPSFTRPLEPDNAVQRMDTRLGHLRSEVRSRQGDSHLGHVFDDGPRPTGLRYCINSAALRFIPANELAEKGYGQYLHLFR